VADLRCPDAGVGHVETIRPLWTRIVRWLANLAITDLLGVTVGRPWTVLRILGLPLAGATFHLAWCLKHGIHPLDTHGGGGRRRLSVARPGRTESAS